MQLQHVDQISRRKQFASLLMVRREGLQWVESVTSPSDLTECKSAYTDQVLVIRVLQSL